MADHLLVSVCTVNGDIMEVYVAPTSSIGDLKKQLVKVAGVPLPLQQVLLGETLLGDYETVASHFRSDEGRLEVMLVTVLSNDLTADLKSPRFEKRMAALKPFLAAGAGCQVALLAVLEMLRDEAEVVRCEALRVLAEMVLNTDDEIIASITPEARSLCEAFSILAMLSKDVELPHTSIGTKIQQVTQELHSAVGQPLLASSLHVWYDALKVLAVLGEQGTEAALDAMINRLEHEEEWFRCAAVISMSEMSLDFDDVKDHMDHEDPRVRCLALRALTHIANITNERSIARDVVKMRLADEDTSVRSAATYAMAEIAYYPEIWTA